MASSSSPKPLLYACIAFNSTILTEHTASAASSASSIASDVLPKITHAAADKKTLIVRDIHVHYIAASPSELPAHPSAGGLTYLVVARADLSRAVSFGFLLTIKERFLKAFPPASTDFEALDAYGAAAFNTKLKELMFEKSGTEAGQRDAIRTAQEEIAGVRDIMADNIERVVGRGAMLDSLISKTDALGGNARSFNQRSRGLRRRMWWKNVKLMVLLVVVVVFLLYLFVGFGCGLPAWSKCVGR